MKRRSFDKYEGLGNDFVVIGVADEKLVSNELARSLCDRRRGVGGDGVLLVLPARDGRSDARMKVINADGSVPEMCGNGIRCVALQIARARGMTAGKLAIETDAGSRCCRIDDVSGEGIVTVDMGTVRVEGARSIDLGDETVEVWVVDAGNPHAVVFGDATCPRAEQIGPPIERHPLFPRGTNVECARLDGRSVEFVVWERGVGVTLACGTGACATVAAFCARGLLPRGERVVVRLPGGELSVTIAADGRATMRGPARHVFSGSCSDVPPHPGIDP